MATEYAEFDPVLGDIIEYVYHGQIKNEEIYERARVALLDAMGCAIETLHLSSDCEDLIGPIVPGIIVPGGVRIPGTEYVVDPLKGAFDIGALIRYLDHNDAYAGAEWGHPSDNLGAILSVADWLSQQRAEEQPRPTMRTVLEAQIKAYEIQGVLQQRNAFNEHGLDHVILVKVASTAVIAWMLGLPESAALAAVSHAWIDGHPLRTYRQAPNAGPRKGWAGGDACMRAVHLAFLSKRGGHLDLSTSTWTGRAAVGVKSALTAPKWGFNQVLYGGKDVIQAYPYGTRVMETVLFKVITAEGHGISAVEAAIEVSAMLQRRKLVAERDISAIRIRTQRPAMTIIDKTGPLRNNADRDHSIQYMVATPELKPFGTGLLLLRIRDSLRDYYNPEIRSVANAIAVELQSGEVLKEIVVEFPVGHHKRPETLARVMEKFRQNMALMFVPEEVDQIIGAAGKDQLPVDEFMGLFVRKRVTST
ncbi:uncharacterized protein N7477_006932 [Penicillium maclennaniae]|uniref:uncharacterized protein n=1 Tax=Penicillium maclennaniae TaxID=1343394 RepID=UPI0025417285|nr:uncharacterized protein N7477_006932 [Penicillium maclennaniae]KAJ5668362.1 hypothetical protein N7477_006932 [Penicillium maclennaniae]